MENEQKKISCEIVQCIGVISEIGSWKKELNIVQWGDNIAKYDIRSWNANHSQSGKGVTLSQQELRELKNLLINMDL